MQLAATPGVLAFYLPARWQYCTYNNKSQIAATGEEEEEALYTVWVGWEVSVGVKLRVTTLRSLKCVFAPPM